MLSPLSHSRCSTNVNETPPFPHGFVFLLQKPFCHWALWLFWNIWRETEPGLDWDRHCQNQGRQFPTATNLEINLFWWLKHGKGFTWLTAERNWLCRRPAHLALGDARNLLPANRGAPVACILRASTLDSATCTSALDREPVPSARL